MSQRALGAQFHVTTHELAEKLLSEGRFKVGGPSGFGGDKPVHNQGAGVYTAPRFAAENYWASEIATSPFHQDNGGVRLKTVRVEHPADAKVHHVEVNDHFYTRSGAKRRNAEGIASHLAQHPDVAAHYVPDPGEMGTASLTRAAHAAGYDAVAYHRGEADEVVWNPASAHKLKPRELPARRPQMTHADSMREFDIQMRLRKTHNVPVGTPLPDHLNEQVRHLAGTHGLARPGEREDWGEHS